MTGATPPPPDLFDRRVLLVSGKGGAGKTTVAAALAIAAVRTGRRVLLAEVEGRDGAAGLLGLEPPGFAERATPWGFSLLSITPREALLEYLWLFFHMRTLARTLRGAKVLDVATEAIPGFRDLMTAGKLYELTQWRDGTADARRRPYDVVVVDAPPTGQLVPFLQGPAAYRDLIRVGRPHRQLGSIERLMRDGSHLVLVSLPEELSVQETEETAAQLGAEGLPFSAVVVNRLRPAPFPRGVAAAAGRLTPEAMEAILGAAGARVTREACGEALASALGEAGRAESERRRVRRLERLGPVLTLPLLATERFGRAEVEALSRELPW
jgi:anion-transporting  ArsA/GET3 family ATPase